jgi:Na+/proline symporter
VNVIDYVVVLGTMLGIAAYGIWRTRGRRDLQTYFKGDGSVHWFVVGLSVMATQASAVTFLSTPGQGYESGLGFVQNYFGAPFALIIISAFFVPIFRRLNVYTAYEYLGKRFDTKTRLLGAALFLLQRGMQAGITIYAPAIVLSAMMGWRLDLTILATGTVVVAYTVAGGTDAVSHTQKYQLAVIFAGMFAAFFILLAKLPSGVSFSDALTIAGGYNKLQAVDASIDTSKRYTLWSGIFGGMFLALSYFGTDQTQVQRYLSTTSIRESRLGLMFNAVCKIPMQFFILLLGTMLFVFYQFHPLPLTFDRSAMSYIEQHSDPERLKTMEAQFADAQMQRRTQIQAWLDARRSGDAATEASARAAAIQANTRIEAMRAQVTAELNTLGRKAQKDSDYIFITFILNYLPHGVIGLLVAVFFAATLSSKAGELNALASTTVVDLYRHVIHPHASDRHYVRASRAFTIFWGAVSISFALFASMKENLIEAGNIVSSVFYGVPLAVFLVAFFLRWIGGTAIFFSAIITQIIVIVCYFKLPIGYLWYNLIGCGICVGISLLLQVILGPLTRPADAETFVAVQPNDA